MRGIVRNNNPFLTYFSLILRDVSGHISKIQDIFITKETFRYFFLIRIHSMQGLTATTRHGVKKKKRKKTQKD